MKVVYQGVAGAYSHICSQKVFPDAQYIPCATFEQAMEMTYKGLADVAVIPVENSNAGRVTDVHFLLPKTNLFICGEYFLRVEHQLLGLHEANLSDIVSAYSHPQALAQSSSFLENNNIAAIARIDTAKSCENIVAKKDKSRAAIASKLAGQIYGLKVLAANIENANDNTTRFLIMTKEKQIPQDDGQRFITSLLFATKSIPSALYKALGGFATNGINITKLESYMFDAKDKSAQFYVEIESHPDRIEYKNAIKELGYFSYEICNLGTYCANPYRD